ncbi:uncharacterized protein LOC6548074 [Drosophila erecta]|uniref:Ionotropic glutamate receptor C-terminal domain-containing protein n=1 Tax=Drosophila erecta TaxID=7220 RepID=A0A0Q5VW95_DROER|nr:uncharacterized protein LOC6548074 [Drosophila erecta]KQS63125.1 uncharacterized protein Dere_GG22973 [Drosophila erecta]
MRLAIILVFLSPIGTQSASLSGILVALRKELRYTTILVVGGSPSCWGLEPFRSDVPIINMRGMSNAHPKGIFNTRMLALACLQNQSGDAVKSLYGNLDGMRDTPTLLVASSDEEMRDLFLGCFSEHMLNVLALAGSDTEFIYSYQAFPALRVIRRKVAEVQRYFAPQLKDLGGHTVTALPSNIMPCTIWYRDAEGKCKLSGYLHTFLWNYVDNINATLKIWDVVPEEGKLHFTVSRLSKVQHVDFPLEIVSLYNKSGSQQVPMEISSWFLMLPMEDPVPRAHLFVKLGLERLLAIIIVVGVVLGNAHRLEMGLSPSWRCYYVADRVLRGALAQTIILPRRLSPKLMFIYCLLLLSGFFLSNYYLANLTTWLVHPPASDPVLKWKEFRLRQLKVLITPEKLDYLSLIWGTDFTKAYSDIFRLTNSTDFQRRRIALDPSYAYPVSTSLWPFLEQSQVRLWRPLFRRSKELVFQPFQIMSMPLPRNSIFYKSVLRYAALTRETGLYVFWFRRSYYELVALRKISYKEDEGNPYCDLKWTDFLLVWLGFLGGTCMNVLVLLLEVAHYKWHARNAAL